MSTLQGYTALQHRLEAIRGVRVGPSVMRTLGAATVMYAKQAVPRKTGNLGRTIHVSAVTPVSVRVEASANYARYVEEGTRPHEITPNAAKALRWASRGGARLTGTPTKAAQRGGGVIFAKRVHHPGTKAEPFLRPSAEKAIATAGLLEVVVQAWNEAA